MSNDWLQNVFAVSAYMFFIRVSVNKIFERGLVI